MDYTLLLSIPIAIGYYFNSCDLPLIDQDTISHLWSSCKSGEDIVPEVNGELQTTCAFYNKRLKDLVLEQINNRRFSLKELISKVNHPFRST